MSLESSLKIINKRPISPPKQTYFATILFWMQHWDSEKLLNQKPPADGAVPSHIIQVSSVLCLLVCFVHMFFSQQHLQFIWESNF